jgi:hypothetical protein
MYAYICTAASQYLITVIGASKIWKKALLLRLVSKSKSHTRCPRVNCENTAHSLLFIIAQDASRFSSCCSSDCSTASYLSCLCSNSQAVQSIPSAPKALLQMQLVSAFLSEEYVNVSDVRVCNVLVDRVDRVDDGNVERPGVVIEGHFP